jgi:hypothetical protein
MKRLLYILLFLPLFANGQYYYGQTAASPGTPTRMYFSSTSGGTAITPSYDGGWNVTTSADRRLMGAATDGTSIASKTTGTTGASAVMNILNVQFISAQPLAAQTISGSIKMQMRGNMSSTTSRTGAPSIVIKVVAADGTTVRGTLYSSIGTGFGTNYTTTLTNRALTSTAVTPVTASDGDYLVVEIGWTYKTGTNTSTTATQSFGSSSGTDLTEDNTTTTANNPWIEFSNGILWQTPTLPTTNLWAYYEADDAASITQSSNIVSQWADKSGHGHNWTQSTSAYRPTWDGVSIITFDGNNDQALTLPTINIAQPITVYTILSANITTSGSGIFIFGDPSFTQYSYVSKDATTGNVFLGISASSYFACTDLLTTTNFYCTQFTFNNASSAIRLNSLTATGGSIGTASNYNATVVLGSAAGISGGSILGVKAQYIYVGSSIPPMEDASIRAYLTYKWGKP